MSIIRRARRRPSPAMLVACLALFIALGGTSYALTVGAVGSREIHDGSIASIDVQNRSLRGKDMQADSIGGHAIKEETLDLPKLAVQLRVFVELDGRYTQGRGIVNVQHLQTGIYNVIFDRDVSDCFPVTTSGSRLAYGGDVSGASEIKVRPNGDDVHALTVYTGNSAGDLIDYGFYLLVFC